MDSNLDNIPRDICYIICNHLVTDNHGYSLMMLTFVCKWWNNSIKIRYVRINVTSIDAVYVERSKLDSYILNMSDSIVRQTNKISGMFHKVIEYHYTNCLLFLMDLAKNLSVKSATLIVNRKDNRHIKNCLRYVKATRPDLIIKTRLFFQNIYYRLVEEFGLNFGIMILPTNYPQLDWEAAIYYLLSNYFSISSSDNDHTLDLDIDVVTYRYYNLRIVKYLIDHEIHITQLHFDVCIDLNLVLSMHVIYTNLIGPSNTLTKYIGRSQRRVTYRVAILRSKEVFYYLSLYRVEKDLGPLASYLYGAANVGLLGINRIAILRSEEGF